MLGDISKYIRTIVAAALAVAVAASVSSCFDGMTDNSVKDPLKVSHDTLRVGRAASVDFIGITSRDAGWTLTGYEEWCNVSQSSGEAGKIAKVEITFLANESEVPTTRRAIFVITAGTEIKKVVVEQLPVDIILPNQDPEYPVNEHIFDEIIKPWYYWDEEVDATRSDPNQPYRSFFDDYLTYLKQNELDGNIWSRETERYLYSYITRTPVAQAGLNPLTYGMEFDLHQYTVENTSAKMVARVLYVLDGSPAYAAGLRRGDWFYKINDVPMADWIEVKTGEMQYKRLIDTLVRPVEGESPRLGMLTYQPHSGKVFDANRTVTVSPARFHGSPILGRQVFEVAIRDDGGSTAKVGYLAYNSFDPLFEPQLVEVFAGFKRENITHLVLDLRYNKTGTVEMARRMANLIVPESMNGKTFARLEFNSQHTALNKELNLSADAASVGLTTVFILTSKHTAGAAELLINGLNGLDGMKVVMIGDTTEGMNTGMVVRTYRSEDYEYKARLVAFRCYNGLDDNTKAGDYHAGLMPNGGTINEWDGLENKKWRQNGAWGWSGATGATEDQLLLRAVNTIRGNIAMPVNSVNYGSSKQRDGYVRIFSVREEMIMEGVPE